MISQSMTAYEGERKVRWRDYRDASPVPLNSHDLPWIHFIMINKSVGTNC